MKHNENAKDPKWKVPVDLPHVKPEDYDVCIDSGRGSAKAKRAPEPNKPSRQP